MISGIRQQQSGFTIIEVIIVLTISMALLGSAMVIFNQKIPRTQFATAVNEFALRLTNAGNQVMSGYYPNEGNIKCTQLGGISDAGGTSESGTNAECLFIGQAVQFGVSKDDGTGCSEASPDDRCDLFNFYAVWGRRTDPSNKVVTSLADSEPKISIDYAQENYHTGYGLHITSAYVNDSSKKIGGIAYLQTFGSTAGVSSSPVGATQVRAVPLLYTSIGQKKGEFVGDVETNNSLLSPPQSNGMLLCLKSAATDQYATIILGRNGNISDVEKNIYNKKSDWTGVGCS